MPSSFLILKMIMCYVTNVFYFAMSKYSWIFVIMWDIWKFSVEIFVNSFENKIFIHATFPHKGRNVLVLNFTIPKARDPELEMEIELSGAMFSLELEPEL